MAKRIDPEPMEVELRQRLDTLANENRSLQKSMDQIHELLKGSSVLNYKGVIRTFEELQIKMEKVIAQMDHWERWRQVQIAKKGTFTFKTANLFTKGLTILGGLSLAAGTIYTIIQIVGLLTNK